MIIEYTPVRHDICQKFTPPDYQGKNFTPTLKVRNL